MKAHRQRGVAVLLTAVVLLALMGLISITLNRSGVMEQRMAASQQRALEAEAAVEGALSWFFAWMEKNNLQQANWVDDAEIADPLWQVYSTPPSPPTIDTYSSGHIYTPSLRLTRSTAYPTRFRVTASVNTTDAKGSLSGWFTSSGPLPGGWKAF